ncbi:zinc ribbon domain-containing protein [Leyella stercorea]|jgi:Pyruvate/2-oxoacid:ferredoxin oxidoreductase gamma subunit|uniref:zinc ribbon domain-containing protein n=1 Tax=Leyella stercorea TaxID=363265 RepID=UPI002671EEFE|nr:zinc ribbon domain-containing protein [Leyella stercorea]
MYCKKCGKQISDDSKYCKHCGILVDETVPANNADIPTTTQELKSEVVVTSRENTPVKIEISKKTTIKESTIANEIVANLKMVGIAVILWSVYILGFMCMHSKDTKTMNENSWYGESCYDPSSLSGNWMMAWQNQYAIKVLMAPDYSKQKRMSNWIEALSFSINYTPLDQLDYDRVLRMNKEEAFDYASSVAKSKKLNNDIQERLKKEATEDARKDKEDFWDTINSYRKDGYENDLHNNMKWAAIIAFSLTILVRYIVKFGKWVATNKSK